MCTARPGACPLPAKFALSNPWHNIHMQVEMEPLSRTRSCSPPSACSVPRRPNLSWHPSESSWMLPHLQDRILLMAVLSRDLLAVSAQGAQQNVSSERVLGSLSLVRTSAFITFLESTQKCRCECLSLATCLIRTLVSLCICISAQGIWNQNNPFHQRCGCIAVILLLPISCEKPLTQIN